MHILVLLLLKVNLPHVVSLSSSPHAYQSPPFAGTGPRQVDMNMYNLPTTSVIEEQWIANIVPDTVDTKGGIFLGCQNDREYFVDSFSISIPRPNVETSLGIELIELAGGGNIADKRLGITVIQGIVEGGYVEQCNVDLLPGDSISSFSILSSSRRPESSDIDSNDVMGLTDNQKVVSFSTECLSFDATVDVIQNLPPPTVSQYSADGKTDEVLQMVIKRLRRKPKVKVNLRYPPSEKKPDESLELFAGENLRLGMLVRGAKVNDPFAKRFDTKSGGNCGAGGLCRTCAVSVLRGSDLINPQKISEKQMLQDNPRWRLACKAFVGYGMKEGEITLQVNPRQW